MKRKGLPPDDPVVREVRAIRKRLWKKAGGTIEGLVELLDQTVPRSNGKKARTKKSLTRRA